MTVRAPDRVRPAAWVAFVVAGLVCALVAWLAPFGGTASWGLVIGVEVASVAALAWVIRDGRPRPATPWLIFLAGTLAYLAANLGLAIAGTASVASGPAWPGVVLIAAYGLMIVAVAGIARALGAGRDRGDIVDTLIVTAGAAMVALGMATMVAGEAAARWEPAAIVAAFVPVGGDLVLIAIGGIIFLRIGRVTPAIALLSAALAAQVAGDLLVAIDLLGDASLVGWFAPLAAIEFACFGAAMLHPSAMELYGGRPAGAAVSARTRMAFLTGIAVFALLAAILLQLVPGHADVDAAVDLMAFVIVILFALRAWILMEQLSHANAALARTETDLEERSGFVAGISEAMPGALFGGDLATLSIDYASPGLRMLLGVDPASAIGKPGWILERIHPDDREEFVAQWTAARAEGRTAGSFENRMRTEDGEYRHVASSVRFIRGPSGDVDRFVGVGIDVTDRVEAERSSHEREVLIAHLVQASSAIIIAGHRAGGGEVIDFISPSIEQVLGYRPDEIVGVPGFVQSRIHRDDLARRERQLDDSAASGGGVVRDTRRLLARDGSYRSVELSSRVEVGEDGLVRYVTSGVDVTERVDLEVELAQSLAFLDRILDTSPGVVLVGRVGEDRLEYVSPGVRQALGYEPSEVAGVEGWGAVHVHPDDAVPFAEAMERAARGGGDVIGVPVRMRGADGAYHPLLAMVRPFVGDDGAPRYVATAVDISARLAMEEELRGARDAAEAANRAKSEFLSLMSHEFRTPLNAILGFGRLLDASDLPPADRESVEFILRSGTALLGMIDRVLDFARLETGRLDMTLEPILAEDAVRRALELVRQMAADRQATIDGPSEQTGIVVLANGQRLVTVVQDLLDNALRHGGAGVHVSVSVESAGDGRARIRVIDDGVGMDEDQVLRVFKPFEAGRDGEAALGLSLGRRLIQAMGGTLDLESGPGRGTISTITLPEERAGDGEYGDGEPGDRAIAAPGRVTG